MTTQPIKSKTDAKEARKLLEQAWTYYTPEPFGVGDQREPELFQYANTA